MLLSGLKEKLKILRFKQEIDKSITDTIISCAKDKRNINLPSRDFHYRRLELGLLISNAEDNIRVISGGILNYHFKDQYASDKILKFLRNEKNRLEVIIFNESKEKERNFFLKIKERIFPQHLEEDYFLNLNKEFSENVKIHNIDKMYDMGKYFVIVNPVGFVFDKYKKGRMITSQANYGDLENTKSLNDYFDMIIRSKEGGFGKIEDVEIIKEIIREELSRPKKPYILDLTNYYKFFAEITFECRVYKDNQNDKREFRRMNVAL